MLALGRAVSIFLVCLMVLVVLNYVASVRPVTYSRLGPKERPSTKALSLTTLEINSSIDQFSNSALPLRSTPTLRFHEGVPKPPGATYSRTMVVPRMKDEDISWIGEQLPTLNVTVYVANDPLAPLHSPKNKGHEVMVYFSYIIDHYESLPDIVIFMHAHRFTHHNNELLGYDAPQMIRRLSNEHVIRQGYVNMRCNWSPGCPEWLHPDPPRELMGKQEEAVLAESWHELFPHDFLPKTLAQSCCAQFALSRERILAIPKARFVFYRDWIMRTPLSDYVSGRIWEYSWQFLFTGQSVFCPAEHICYCDGYGICFGDQARYSDFEELRRMKQGFEEDLGYLKKQRAKMQEMSGRVGMSKSEAPQTFDAGRCSSLSDRIEALEKELRARKEEAIERGNNPRNRADECGRPWKEGQGF